MKKITWHKFQQKRGEIEKTSRTDKFFTAISIFNGLFLIIVFLSIRTNPEVFNGIKEITYFENSISGLDNSNYTDTYENIIFLVNNTCKFNELDYSIDDVFCVTEEVLYAFNNKANVFDYNMNGELDCKDHTVSLIYILRKFGINAWPIMTDNHVLALVKLDPYFYAFVDPSYGGFDAVGLKDYIYGKLGNQ